MRVWHGPIAALCVAATLLAPTPSLAQTTCLAPDTYPDGAVLSLEGTPHLWLAVGGALRWMGDTRALASRTVRWDRSCVMSASQLQGVRKGDPFLSAGLVKIGDPIYLAKWETTDTAPTLLHIQSIADVEVFGINAQNYGKFVLDGPAWEQRFGFTAGRLRQGELSSAIAAGSPARSVTPVASGAASKAPVASAAGALVRALGSPTQITLNIQIRETTRQDHLYGLLELAPVNKPVVWCAYHETYTVACSSSMSPRKDAASDEHNAFEGAVVDAMAAVGYDLFDIDLVGYNGTGWFYFERGRR
jgi:hypothetical protein